MTNVRFFKNGVFTANPTPEHMRAVGATSSSVKANDGLNFKIAEDPQVLGNDTLGVDADRAVLGEITDNMDRLNMKDPPPV